MSDTRYLTVGVRMQADVLLHLGGGSGTAGVDVTRSRLRSRGSQRPSRQSGVDGQYRWSGFMAMTPDRYPRLFELAPGVAALGYSGRGICTATIMGRELARWAAGEAGIDALALPASSFRTLPYLPLRGIVINSAMSLFQRPRSPELGQASV